MLLGGDAVTGRGWCVALLLLAGCSRALPFNFAFTSVDGGGQGQQDLAAPQDLAVSQDLNVGQGDMVKPLDQSIGDLATSVDLSSADLAVKSDLAKPTDLRAGDLASPDLRPVDLLPLTFLGKACEPQSLNACGIATGLDCLTHFQTEAGEATIEGGYCTKACNEDSECVAQGGACSVLGKSGKVCMRACSGSCERVGYGCCSYSGSGMTTTTMVCQPPLAPDYVCISGGP